VDLFTIAGPAEVEVPPTKGSRFIARAAPVATELAAKEALRLMVTEWPDASHHCWAWCIAEPRIDRAGDDGEPSGSAGRPILAQLNGRNLVNVAVVVTRYFGGTKLGVGGLVRAYGQAAGSSLERAALLPYRAMTEIMIVHSYADEVGVTLAIGRCGGESLNATYSDQVRRSVQVPRVNLELLMAEVADATAGRAVVNDGLI